MVDLGQLKLTPWEMESKIHILYKLTKWNQFSHFWFLWQSFQTSHKLQFCVFIRPADGRRAFELLDWHRTTGRCVGVFWGSKRCFGRCATCVTWKVNTCKPGQLNNYSRQCLFYLGFPFPPNKEKQKASFQRKRGLRTVRFFRPFFAVETPRLNRAMGCHVSSKLLRFPIALWLDTSIDFVVRFWGFFFFMGERDCFTFVSFVFVGEVSQEGTVSVDFHDFGWFLLGLCLYVWLIRSSDFFIRQSCREGSSEQLRLALVFTCYLFCCYSFPFPSTWKVEDHPG